MSRDLPAGPDECHSAERGRRGGGSTPRRPRCERCCAARVYVNRNVRLRQFELTEMARKIPGRKRPGRPVTTRTGTLVGLRCHEPFLSAVDEWRKRQVDKPTRQQAILRLAQNGLASGKPMARTNPKAAAKAKELAETELDRIGDSTSEARAKRRRSLISGAGEFPAFRSDHRETGE
jgi:hypothetical protein